MTADAATRLEGDFDYIVVGAGSAGCVLANRLSADPSSRVLLLEAGGRDNWIWFHIPVGYLFAIGNPRSDWMFETEKEPGLNGRSLNYPRGKVIGGSSAINAMISMRGQAQDYDHWRQLGLTGWGWDDVRPVFKRLDNHFLGDTEHHGAGGEWRVEQPRVKWDVLDAVAKAAIEMGIPATPDFNTGDNTGVGYFHVNQKRGLRWSAARAFLKPVLGRRQPPARDRRAGREGGVRRQARGRRAVPAERPARRGARQGRGHPVGRRRRLAADPAALRRRPGRLARRARHRRWCTTGPGVGRNLQDHLQQRAIFKVHGVKTLNETYHSLIGRGLMGAAICPVPEGPAHHGALAARHLHHVLARPRAGQHRVPRPAAVARQVRRAAASLSRPSR